MEKEVKIKTIGKYNGHSVKTNRIVDLSLKFQYDEMVNYIQSIQMLNENLTLKIKISDKPGKNIGTFMIDKLIIDGDGEAVLKLKSQIDNVNPNDINEMVVSEPFKIMLEAVIEVEENEDENWEE